MIMVCHDALSLNEVLLQHNYLTYAVTHMCYVAIADTLDILLFQKRVASV